MYIYNLCKDVKTKLSTSQATFSSLRHLTSKSLDVVNLDILLVDVFTALSVENDKHDMKC